MEGIFKMNIIKIILSILFCIIFFSCIIFVGQSCEEGNNFKKDCSYKCFKKGYPDYHVFLNPNKECFCKNKLKSEKLEEII